MFDLMFVSKTTMGCFLVVRHPERHYFTQLNYCKNNSYVNTISAQVLFYPDILNFYSTIQSLIYKVPFFNFLKLSMIRLLQK